MWGHECTVNSGVHMCWVSRWCCCCCCVGSQQQHHPPHHDCLSVASWLPRSSHDSAMQLRSVDHKGGKANILESNDWNGLHNWEEPLLQCVFVVYQLLNNIWINFDFFRWIHFPSWRDEMNFPPSPEQSLYQTSAHQSSPGVQEHILAEKYF